MSNLEKASHVAVILLSVVAIVSLIVLPRVSTPPTQASAAKMVGRKLELPGARWTPGTTSVVIAMTSECRFCLASIPFYRQLASAASRSSGHVSVLVASLEPTTDGVKSLLFREGVAATQVIRASATALGVPGTPTLFVVDGAGVVKQVFVGKLSETRQEELLRLLDEAKQS